MSGRLLKEKKKERKRGAHTGKPSAGKFKGRSLEEDLELASRAAVPRGSMS
jgi:hypothetical protein